MKALSKFIIGVALLPFCIASCIGFIKLLTIFISPSSFEICFLAGIVIYGIFELIFSKPLRTYVFGHELSHVAAALLCGGRPKKFKVSKKGGSVTLTKTNFFISLAPYILPIYTIFLVLIYYVLKYFFDMAPFHIYFVGLMGFTLAFHLRLTFFAITQGQPDIKTTGIVFSLSFIVIVNFLVLAGLIKLLFPFDISITGYFEHIWDVSKRIYIWIYITCINAYRFFIKEIS